MKAQMGVIGIIGIVDVILVILMVGLYIFTPPRPLSCTETITPIKSLELGDKYRGSFFLGSGSIGDIPYYFVYRQEGDGWVLGKYYAERWILREGTDRPSSLVVRDCVSGTLLEQPTRTLEIFVPNGTIISAYTADVAEAAK